MEKREIRESLLRAEKTRRQLIRPRLRELGLTPGQGQVGILNRLLQNPNLSQRELADLCHLDVTTMSRSLDRMEEMGFLKREKNPDCRRSYQVCLTPAGEIKAREVQALLKNMDEIICGELTEEEREVFLNLMRKICDNMERGKTPETGTQKEV